MINSYYEILGVSPDAELQEIKRAYRIKAKKLHPDVNSSSDAHQQFVLLNKAYKYICDFKEGKITRATYRSAYKPKPEPVYKKNTSYDGRRKWSEEELNRARAKIRAEKAKKDAEDKKLERKVDKIRIIILLSFFIASLFFNRSYSFYLMLLVIVLNWKKLKNYIDKPLISQLNIWLKSILNIVNSRFFSLFFSIFFSIIVFFRIAVNTLIPIHYTLLMYFIVFFVPLLIGELFKNNKQQWVKSLIFPLVLNLFFAFNFTFSNNAFEETYIINDTAEKKSTLIILENNSYEDFLGLRLFFDYQEIAGNKKVTFYFEEGLFGLKVLKGYEFFKRKD